ncbi:MAG TPA: hypothetical protein DHU55_08340 [Blastocatellia bacterium]|nr:hypothetical protein [Blastocatellia bacterium]
MRSEMSANKYSLYGRYVFVFMLAMTFCVALPSATADAKKRKNPNYGTIKIQSNPAGLDLQIDGKPSGKTTADFTAIERLDPGLHTILITLPDSQQWRREIDLPAGRIKCVSINYRPNAPVAASLCPFPVKLSAPSQVSEGEVITYAADVNYNGTAGLVYTWTVNPADARIISGAGTPTITVDSTALGGQRITATLVVDDGSGAPLCRQTVQASTFTPRTPKRDIVGSEFDTCCNCSYDDQKARLDNLAVELQNDPSTTTYLMAYAGRTSRAGESARLLARARDYLVTHRGVDASRINLINGGFREDDCVEVWVVPRGAVPPQPRPTVQAGDVRPAPVGALRRRKH